MTQERITLAGFASIAALVITLFGWTRADLGDLRTDMNGLRSEIRADMNELRSEIGADMNALRTGLRTDMNARFGEVNARFDEVNTRLDGLEEGQALLVERVARLEGALSTALVFASRTEDGARPEGIP